MTMEVDIERKGILIGLLDWLYEEFGDDLPAAVRMPIHLALAIAHKADPKQKAKLKHATKADIENAILHSSLAAEYAAKGMLKAQAIDDAVRYLQRAFVEGVDSLHAEHQVINEKVAGLKGDTETILDEVRRHARRSRERGELGKPFTLTPPRRLPPRHERFTGRQEELEEIHRRLSKRAELGVTQQTAAHGLGGVGKTSVAVEYAWSRLDDYPGGVFFIGCDTDLLIPVVADLAPNLGMEDAETQAKTAEIVRMRLESGPTALLILDNVRNAEQWSNTEWSKHLPGQNCRRLITTRSARISTVKMYPIQRFPREQGIELLAKYREDAGLPDNREIVGDVVDWFDGLAVGLTVVGVYMSIHDGLSWSDYAAALEEKGLGAVRAMETDVGPLPDYDQRVDAIIDETFAALPSPQQRTLEYAALLPEDAVPRPWLAWLLAGDEEVELPSLPGYEEDPARSVIDHVVRCDLLRTSADDENVLSLHRVLRARLTERLAEDDALRSQLLDRIVELAEACGKASRAAVTNRSIRWELTPLARLSEALASLGRFDAAVNLLNWILDPTAELGRFDDDKGLLGRFVDDENVQGTINPQEAATLSSNYAVTVWNLGEFQAAQQYIERAIEIKKRKFDPDHPSLAKSYSNLATILWDLGDLPEARRYTERAIAIFETHLDPEHPDLAIRYSNLATILRGLGDLGEARRYMNRAIEIDEKHFDCDHPNLATSYNNLAHVELEDGNKTKACEVWRRAYAILTKHFDDEHPNVQDVARALRRHCAGAPGDEGKPAD